MWEKLKLAEVALGSSYACAIQKELDQELKINFHQGQVFTKVNLDDSKVMLQGSAEYRKQDVLLNLKMKLFSKSLKPEEVINFLKENPDFFIDHPEAIEHLEIKHESGEAVSFIEKQVEFIKSKNLATSTQLKDFILNANANELLFAKVRKLINYSDAKT